MNQCNLLANINSFETMGLVDGPGIRVVVFMQGCNLRCAYCHNPETWCLNSENKMSVEQVVDKILKYKNYIIKNGGVTFSGGEPLLQSEFIYECCKRLKKEGIHICVDTSGVGFDYEMLIDLVDLFIVDIKSVNDEEYKYITGHSMDEYNKFMDLLQRKNKKVWLRQVVVPSINDDEKHMIDLALYVKKLKNIEKVELLPYHTMGKDKYVKLNVKYRLENIENMSKRKLEYLKEILNKNLGVI